MSVQWKSEGFFEIVLFMDFVKIFAEHELEGLDFIVDYFGFVYVFFNEVIDWLVLVVEFVALIVLDYEEFEIEQAGYSNDLTFDCLFVTSTKNDMIDKFQIL